MQPRLKLPIIAMAIISLLFIDASFVCAEQIKIPVGKQNSTHTIAMPVKGMSKAAVEAAFGSPLEAKTAKGSPPITQWKYTDFVVYFENDHVIHSVAIFQPQTNREIIIAD